MEENFFPAMNFSKSGMLQNLADSFSYFMNSPEIPHQIPYRECFPTDKDQQKA
jgi:hypothetical protein